MKNLKSFTGTQNHLIICFFKRRPNLKIQSELCRSKRGCHNLPSFCELLTKTVGTVNLEISYTGGLVEL